MADRQWKITATRPVLIVSNIERSVAFYTSIGFEETFRNDVVHSVLRIGDLFVHLGTKMEYAGAGLSQALIEMENVDDYYAFCKAQNAKINREIANRFYGLRSFNLADIDGNIIEFAERIKEG